MNKIFDSFRLLAKGSVMLVSFSFFTDSSVAQDGHFDTSFDPGTGTNGQVLAVVKHNSKIIIGGGFSSFNGTTVNGIARLHSDGSLDTGFNSLGNGVGGIVKSMVVQPDGRVIVAGDFITYNDSIRRRIVRINNDGSLDLSFNIGKGANDEITSVSLQPDGGLIIGGSFTSFDTVNQKYFARLDSNGTIDQSFNFMPDGPVLSTKILSNGQIIIGGNFTKYDTFSRNGIARVHMDGKLDTTFKPGSGVDGSIWSLAVQQDDKIVAGGSFTTYDGTPRKNIVRINTDGQVDMSFDPGTGADNTVMAVDMQDDKIIAVGIFLTFDLTNRAFVVRLLSDGTPDVSFNPAAGGASSGVFAVAMDGSKILIGGSFVSYDGITCGGIARIYSDASLGVVGMNAKDVFKVYPNPFQAQLMVQLPQITGPVNVRLTDMTGRILFTRSLAALDNKIIITEDIPTGVYILQVSAGELHYRQTIMKQ